MTLQAAATALDALAVGEEPKHCDVLAGALVLQTLVLRGRDDRDLVDAAQGLEAVATGRPLNLDQAGRGRAATLAKKLRAIAAERCSERDHV